jgi:hypothetical protein
MEPSLMGSDAGSGGLLDWAVACQPMLGETKAGDNCFVRSTATEALVVVVDALGHGSEAASAARTAIDTIGRYEHEPLVQLFERCHEALRRTRGVVMSAATFSAADNRISWLGVGNVEGAVLRQGGHQAGEARSFVVRGGVVGYQMPRLQVSHVQIDVGDWLVIATDGLSAGFTRYFSPQAAPQDTVDALLNACAKVSDDALVLAARYCGAST